jgi:hypothetical protein
MPRQDNRALSGKNEWPKKQGKQAECVKKKGNQAPVCDFAGNSFAVLNKGARAILPASQCAYPVLARLSPHTAALVAEIHED